MARLNLMQTIQTGPVGALDGNLEISKVPAWFTNWEKTGLLAHEDKNGDGRIQYYGPGLDDKAAGFGWAGNEMTKVDRDIMVLANPEIANLPAWVIALVAAGGIAQVVHAREDTADRPIAPRRRGASIAPAADGSRTGSCKNSAPMPGFVLDAPTPAS